MSWLGRLAQVIRKEEKPCARGQATELQMSVEKPTDNRTRRPFHRFLWKGASLLVLAAVAALVVAPQFVPVDEDPGPAQAMGGDFLVAYSAATLANEGQ